MYVFFLFRSKSSPQQHQVAQAPYVVAISRTLLRLNANCGTWCRGCDERSRFYSRFATAKKGITMKAMFVPPNTCINCQAHGVPSGLRSTFMLEHESICGYCGNKLWAMPGGELPNVVVSVVRSLLQHGLFHL